MTQLDIDFARAARDDGMARALAHAEEDVPNWGQQAYAFLRSYCEKHEHFAGFMCTAASELDKTFPTPKNERAWGPVYTKVQRDLLIAKTDKRMKHPRRHASEAIVYVSLVYRGAT